MASGHLECNARVMLIRKCLQNDHGEGEGGGDCTTLSTPAPHFPRLSRHMDSEVIKLGKARLQEQ